MVEKIRANAALVVRIAGEKLGVPIDYDEAGVRWLDGYIQEQHESGDPSARGGLVSTLGSHLGECIIRTHGGEWAEVGGNWCVRFDDGASANPFAKVAKQLDHGSEDSVLGFFTVLPMLFRHLRSLAQPQPDVRTEPPP